MVDLRRYQRLHTIQTLRGIIHKWWGLELSFADAEGRVLDYAEGRIIPPGNELCRAALFTKAGFRRCNESMAQVAEALRTNGSTSGACHYECHLGFGVVAVPIELEGRLEGLLFVGGIEKAEPDGARRESLEHELEGFGAPAGVLQATRIRAVPVLGAAHREQIGDLLVLGAAEIAAYHAALIARERNRIQPLSERCRFEHIIGRSPPMQEVFRLLEKISDSDATVLIHGESGTGKELVARAIHDSGPRAQAPFLAQNCSTFNDNLLESSLFGHERGAFTGAVRDKMGLFRAADRGTFFLDEIGDMSPTLQVKLLRVLQEGTFTPVGSTELQKVDVRVIAATHKDLQKMVRVGQFREDLFYRINVIRIVIPPLRERVDDLPLLVDHFLGKRRRGSLVGAAPRLGLGVMEAFQRYAWPGNIRELENEIERMLVLAAGADELPLELVSPRITEAGGKASVSSGRGPGKTLKEAVEALEREVITQGLIRTQWNKSQLAKELGISRSNLIQKCAYYGLDRKEESA